MSAAALPDQLALDRVRDAYKRISPHIKRTPINFSQTFSELCGCETWFKMENLQMTGSFKERGALNRLLALTDEEKKRGVIAASAGNHAQAVAYHASRLGIPVKIVMPKYSPLVKVRSTLHWGAEVVLEGNNFDEAFQISQKIVEEENRVYLHPFDDLLVVEGQATLGLEIIEDEVGSTMDAILVPVGGGGLISGIASYVKQVRPEVEIIGIEEETCNAMSEAMRSGHVVQLPAAPTIADGIAIRKVSATNLDLVNHYVDSVISVNSDEIANGVMLMLEIEKSVIEASAAVTIAALVNDKVPQLKGKRVLSVISGGNIDVNLLSRIINHGLAFDGRIVNLQTIIPDRPGGLETILGTFREAGANILEVHHHRFSSEAPVGQVGVSITCETRNREHIDEIKALLEDHGYVVHEPPARV